MSTVFRPAMGTPEQMQKIMEEREKNKPAASTSALDAPRRSADEKRVAGSIKSSLASASQTAKPASKGNSPDKPSIIFSGKPTVNKPTPNTSSPSGQWYRNDVSTPSDTSK